MSVSAASRNALRTGIILFVFALVGTAILAFTHDRTEPIIARGQQAEKLALLAQVLPRHAVRQRLAGHPAKRAARRPAGHPAASALWLAQRGGHSAA